MKIIALTLLALVASAGYLKDEDIPTLDLRGPENEIGAEPQILNLEGSGSYFKLILKTNPSTGYRWWQVSNPTSNCVCKVKQIDQNILNPDDDSPRVGSEKDLELIYWAELIGKQDIVLVYSRFKPKSHLYDEYAINSKTSRRVQINIGDNDDFSPCQA